MTDAAAAQNLGSGESPDYVVSDFISDFPQFGANGSLISTIPQTLAQKFINMASASLSYSKYQDLWSYCMGLYVAHFCTLFLMASNGATPENVASKGAPASILSSKSVGEVSASYDIGAIAGDLEKWGTFKSTTYGQQLATFAQIAGIGGAVV